MEEAICRYLKEEIFQQLAPGPYGDIEITRLGCRRPVCLFVERAKNIMVVGKCFKRWDIPLEEASLEMEKEYLNLKLLRDRYGMNKDPNRVVNVLGESRELSALLVTEKAPGETLDHYIAKGIYDGQAQELFSKLGHLARFFVHLHRSTETDRPVSPDVPQWYLDKLLNSVTDGLLCLEERNGIEKDAARWWDEGSIFAQDREVVVHGDATPTNLLFQDENVIAVDLESMKWADRCWDLGFIAAELKHHFMWRTADRWSGEPFIGHFLWQYAVHKGDARFFYSTTRKLPLYMALGLLRIARNHWLDKPYRKRLIEEAEQCLRHGP